MSTDAKEAQKARRATKANRAKPRARSRQRPAETLHDDENKRLAQDNSSHSIEIDLHSIDLTEEATEWRRYSNLSAPDERPGYHQRWIRARLLQKNDPTNVQRSFREGWRPRRPDTVPDGHLLPTIQLAQFGEVIGVEDMILCEMPDRPYEQRRQFYLRKRRSQTASTEQTLDDLGERHAVPIYKRNVQTMGRRVPDVAADD